MTFRACRLFVSDFVALTLDLVVDVDVTTGDAAVVLVTALVLVVVVVVGFELASVDSVSGSGFFTGVVLSAGFVVFGNGAESTCEVVGNVDCTAVVFSITGTGTAVSCTDSPVLRTVAG